jgi:NO-binding membrane sensor protein with MHYT domain/signal transduction histidine kinase/CheY-like chemotaxis protein
MDVTTTYNPAVVGLSILIAILASYTALDLGGRIRTATSWAIVAWTAAAAIAMGGGIWSMHFVAMLAFHMSVPVSYDTGLTVLSLLLAIAVTAVGFVVVSRPVARPRDTAVSGLFMGLGIAGMHYTGMAAMQMPANIRYSMTLVACSVLIAICAATVALWLAGRQQGFTGMAVAAIAMGLAISGMHYTGMAAAHFSSSAATDHASGHPALEQTHLALAIGITTILLLCLALTASFYDRRLAERRLREGERRFQDIAEVSGDWIWETDAHHRFVVLEGGSTETLPIRPESLIGRTRWDGAGADPETDADWKQHKIVLDAHGPFRHFRYSLNTPSGARMFISASGKPMFNDASEFVGYRGTATDETAIVEAHQRAEQAESLLRDAVDSIAEGFVIYDRDDRLVLCNESYRRLFSTEADHIIPGASFEEILRAGLAKGAYPDAVGREEEWVAEWLRRQREADGATEQPLSDGRWVLVIKRRMRDGGLAGLRIDITTLKQTQAALRESEARLAQAQKMEAIGNLTGGMAHDFNNVLGAIILNLSACQRLPSGSDLMKQLVTEALESARNGAELIRSLLAFARRQPLSARRISLNDEVSRVHSLLSRIVGKDIEISVELAPGLWPVLTDASQLEACIVNLATNARDAMPKGGRLVIITGNQHLDEGYAQLNPSVACGDYAMIAVSDTGHGMTQDVLAKVFEPFFTTKEQGKGSGLGLSMVFGFAKQSDGHVSIYSEPGTGTTVRLFLPRILGGDQTDEPARPVIPEAPARGNGETVLVVEDDPDMRRVVVRQLTSLNYCVLEADVAAVSLGILAEKPVDLVFSDVVMPGGIDGFEFVERVRKQWPSIKVLLSSGFPGGQTNQRIDHFVPYLSKPYDTEQLARAVRAALNT